MFPVRVDIHNGESRDGVFGPPTTQERIGHYVNGGGDRDRSGLFICLHGHLLRSSSQVQRILSTTKATGTTQGATTTTLHGWSPGR